MAQLTAALMILAALFISWMLFGRDLVNSVVDWILDSAPWWVGNAIWVGGIAIEIALMLIFPHYALLILAASAVAWFAAYGFKRREERRRGRLT